MRGRLLVSASLGALAVAAFAAPAVLAQGAGTRPVTFYIGFTSSTMDGDSVPAPTHRTGAVAGISYEWWRRGHVAFSPGIEYAQKGVRTLYGVAGGGVVLTDVGLGYVEVPLLFSVRGDAIGRGDTRLLVGPTVSLRASCSVSAEGIAGSYTCAQVGQGVTSTDVGVMGGAAVDFGVGAQRYVLAARYEQGLTNVVKNEDARNRALTVTLGLRW